MSVYLKNVLAASVVGLLANSAMAADGTINFTGEISAASCSATAGAGTSIAGEKGKQNINVSLGKISMDSLTGAAGGNIVGGSAINVNLDCGNTAAGLTTVRVQFDPMSGSGVDLKNNKLLKTTGTAKGVGIGIYNSSNEAINLAANEFVNAPLVKVGEAEAAKYSANLNMRAAYVANGDPITPGTANGTLPFTLTYE